MPLKVEGQPSLVDTLQKEWYDATKINTFNTCPRKYYYRHIRELVPKGEIATPLSFGIAIHKALESFYKGTWAEHVPCPAEHPPGPFDDCPYCDGHGKTRRFIADFLELFPAEAENGARTRFIGTSLLLQYALHWKDDPMLKKVEMVEQPFAIYLDHSDCYWVGRIDLLVKDDKRRPWDHKTTSRFGEAFEGGFKIDVQITGYIVAVQTMERDPSINEAVINALRVTTKISNESFMRKITTRMPHEIDEWHRTVGEAIATIRRYKALGEDESGRDSAEAWPQNGQGCFAYNHACEYRSLCLMAPEKREALINAAYVVEKWEPV